ncbi:hypothetical protein B566_EDAN018325 [Ephemera danica]|nr:hypothetical protein B566_EDAN018325 [Ephemera danica]
MNFGGYAYTFRSKEFDIDLVPAIEFQVPYTPEVFQPQNVRKLPKPSLGCPDRQRTYTHQRPLPGRGDCNYCVFPYSEPCATLTAGKGIC